ncbi:MAG: F0F1 ATP synthase subunit gamma [Staphylococcus equorum]|nr:F0F1 ATP synthase subunit gamma [Staphylococcus equorum]
MAENIKTIQLRLDSVNEISKITNAMKLVSMSKLMKFQERIKGLDELAEEFDELQTESYSVDENLPLLAIAVASDLGLASLYNKTIQKATNELEADAIMWIGNQGYERYEDNPDIKLINERIPSDHVVLSDLYDRVTKLMKEYRLMIAIPEMESDTLVVKWRDLNKQLLNSDFIVYEPDYASANQRYQELYTFMTLNEAYYQSKYTENLTRRIAMEQATENAEEMREELSNRYNQIRQEEITQEILELSAGVVQ